MCHRTSNWSGLALVGLGLAAGLVAAGLLPHTPLHASATDKIDTFAIATGACDGDCEAIYFLDFLTGDLNAFVIGRAKAGFAIQGHYATNVTRDLNLGGKTPRFLMVTGFADLQRGGRGSSIAPSRVVVYVAEVVSGKCAAYAIPWNQTLHVQGVPDERALVPVVAFPFRKALPGGGGPKTKDKEDE
jgi:hypothetical protein